MPYLDFSKKINSKLIIKSIVKITEVPTHFAYQSLNGDILFNLLLQRGQVLAYVSYDKCTSMRNHTDGGGSKLLLPYCIRVKRTRARPGGRRKDSGGGQSTKKTERSPRRRGRRRFPYNSRKLCRSLEARSWVTWNRRFVPCSCICKLRTNNIHARRFLFPESYRGSPPSRITSDMISMISKISRVYPRADFPAKISIEIVHVVSLVHPR